MSFSLNFNLIFPSKWSKSKVCLVSLFWRIFPLNFNFSNQNQKFVYFQCFDEFFPSISTFFPSNDQNQKFTYFQFFGEFFSLISSSTLLSLHQLNVDCDWPISAILRPLGVLPSIWSHRAHFVHKPHKPIKIWKWVTWHLRVETWLCLKNSR